VSEEPSSNLGLGTVSLDSGIMGYSAGLLVSDVSNRSALILKRQAVQEESRKTWLVCHCEGLKYRKALLIVERVWRVLELTTCPFRCSCVLLWFKHKRQILRRHLFRICAD